uniref:Uncharacterized protein n=1 Tax=Arundo donax TaxID=35708 RepID=A0A0A8ZL32_ARUDO
MILIFECCRKMIFEFHTRLTQNFILLCHHGVAVLVAYTCSA